MVPSDATAIPISCGPIVGIVAQEEEKEEKEQKAEAASYSDQWSVDCREREGATRCRL